MGLVLVAGLFAVPAEAANRRVAISNYQWSSPEINLDLGEHVTWYWVGPDLMHSVTGLPGDADGLDSDPTNNSPRHDLGDEFKLDFDQPGTYDFRCKLHAGVRGTVNVSATPGDPLTEPDQIPQTKVDLAPPKLDGISLSHQLVFRQGGTLRYSLGEPARISLDYYRFKKGRKRFAGYTTDRGHVGYNRTPFGKRSAHFKPKSGRYMVEVRAIDASHNETKPIRVKFRMH